MNEGWMRALSELLDQKLDEKLGPIQRRLEIVELQVLRMEKRLENVELHVLRLEEVDRSPSNQQHDIVSMLHVVNGKLDSIQKDLEYTYQKTSMNELEINRLKSQ